MTVPSHTLRL